MKISFITTVFNEQETIGKLLDSLFLQTKLPDEIIIVDGGSSDQTVAKIKSEKLKVKNYADKFQVIIKKGNRAVGRNEAIKHANGDLILVSDAGCILDKNWIKNIVKPFADNSVDVVAGYYAGKAKTIFQKCLIPYVLVMSDRVNPDKFLPASRSMAFRKTIWKKAGRFPEQFSHNEDYVFAQTLRKIKARIIFQKDAIVYWLPRKTLGEALYMFYRFALGDAEAGILRAKVILLFLRYSMILYLLALEFIARSIFLAIVIVIILAIYIYWAIVKNYRYVKNSYAFFWLPVIQFTADVAVLSGTIFALPGKFRYYFVALFYTNRYIHLLVILYFVITLSQINWGIPNEQHPFMYHMDEWHGSQSIRNVFKNGTSNISGAAHGAIFFYFTVGLYLIPFTLFHIINPFAIKSPIAYLSLQHALFEVLRLNTLLYGILSIYVLTKIVKDYFRMSPLIAVSLFVFTPLWLTLSNYFKYDIAVVFWMLISLWAFLRYSKKQTLANLLVITICCSLTVAIKISALPLLPLFVIGYFTFTDKANRNYKHLLLALVVAVITLLIFGFPDIVTNAGDYYDLLYFNLVTGPQYGNVYVFGVPIWEFLLKKDFPAIFGYGLFFGFIASLAYWLYAFVIQIFKKQKRDIKKEVFIVLCFVMFFISIVPLKLGAAGSRMLVLLPFVVIILCMTVDIVIRACSKRYRFWIYMVIAIGIGVQMVHSAAWISIKFFPDPRVTASSWIQRHISPGEIIGVENIPIYQMLPDIVVKEFYQEQYRVPLNNRYKYEVIYPETPVLPKIIILTNTYSTTFTKVSSKRDIIQRLERESYKKVATFTPELRYYNTFGDLKVFSLSLLVPAPTDIVIYTKQDVYATPFQPTNK